MEKKLCDTSGFLLRVEPGESFVPSCLTDFLPNEKFGAIAEVTTKNMPTKEGELFVVDSKVKGLIFADIQEPFNQWSIVPTIGGASNAYQSFKFFTDFRLTRVNVSLVQPTASGNTLTLKIHDGFTGPTIAESKVLSTNRLNPDGTLTVINYANFDGITLKSTSLYWIELQCDAPCSGDKPYGWKYRNSDVYSGGNGRVLSGASLVDLSNNGDFGFHVYGIET